MKKYSLMAITIAAGFSIGTAANAQSVGNLLGAPLVAGGNLVTGAGIAHAGLASSVAQVSPTVEPVADGVTNAVVAAGVGTAGTGSSIQANGVLVGSTASGQPVASVGTTQPAGQGTVAALLNGHL